MPTVVWEIFITLKAIKKRQKSALKKRIELNPNSDGIYHILGNIYKKGDTKHALAQAVKLRRLKRHDLVEQLEQAFKKDNND